MWSPSPPFNVDCLSFQHFFCLASIIDKAGGGGGGGRGAAVKKVKCLH